MENSQEQREALLAKQDATLREIKEQINYITNLIKYLELFVELENSAKTPVIELDSSHDPKSEEPQ
ncbi:hypothetical protein H6F95_27655 [Cyanobacteria bacterium FACHB-471]|nr:hypothetical protein [Cyanobacteria bacterium FACHB-471]